MKRRGLSTTPSPKRPCTVSDLARSGAYECAVEVLDSLETRDEAGRSVLFIAAQQGRLDAVRTLLKAGADPDCGALHAAAWTGNVDVLAALVHAGGDVNNGVMGRTPLHWAASFNRVAAVKFLLDKGADVGETVFVAAENGFCDVLEALVAARGTTARTQPRRGAKQRQLAAVDLWRRYENRTLLHVACAGGHIDMIRLLGGKYHVDVDALGDDGSALHEACRSGKFEDVVEILVVELGADLELLCRTKDSALTLAVRALNYKNVDLLLKHGALADGGGGIKPLHLAARFGAAHLVRRLIEAGANVDAWDNKMMTPLLTAAEYYSDCLSLSKLHAVTHLLLSGADPNAQCPDTADSCLWLASIRDEPSLVCLLLEFGADPNIRRVGNYTPLYIAARDNNCVCISYLLSAPGIDLEITNHNDETALFAAARKGAHAAVSLLLEHGADPTHAPNSDKWRSLTPLQVAIQERSSLDVVKTLISHNHDIRRAATDPSSILYIVATNGFLSGKQLTYSDLDHQNADGETARDLIDSAMSFPDDDKSAEFACNVMNQNEFDLFGGPRKRLATNPPLC